MKPSEKQTGAERVAKALMDPSPLTQKEWGEMYEGMWRIHKDALAEIKRLTEQNEHLRMQLMFLADDGRAQ
jgi:hypothetical protein